MKSQAHLMADYCLRHRGAADMANRRRGVVCRLREALRLTGKQAAIFSISIEAENYEICCEMLGEKYHKY